SNPLQPGGNGNFMFSYGEISNSTWSVPDWANDPNGDQINDGWPYITGQPIYRDGSLYTSVNSGLNNGTVGSAPGVLWFIFGIGLNEGILDNANNPCARCDTIKNVYGRENGQIVYSGSGAAYWSSQAVDGDGNVCFSFTFSSLSTWP